ncbi:Kdo hydroxylase family protein [Derxia gummosa]|uniref:Kdo hydroxylase family protein n=1 Tax=Derxia gummosa DSM 723 TaxID=1121388 RepID=A0A8B6X173_9BURK|nr:Kdo hydroxylase family protein [Derxia gummosa]
MPVTPLITLPDTAWVAGAGAPTHAVERQLEAGAVLCLPDLRFALRDAERRFLDPRWGDGKAKNISLRTNGELRGASGTPEEQTELHAMVARYRDQATALAERLFPHYVGKLRLGNTSYRPVAVEGRETSWRKDDTRLHVDAFPSNPTHGTRLLRVFHNLNPVGKPRVWRVGQEFEPFAKHFLPRIKAPFPGSAAVLRALHVTKSLRTPYDHYMLGLHDEGKADLGWQRDCEQATVEFSPGTTWIVFSDQVLHAVMGGQFMMEQTFYLDAADQLQPETSPLRVLERLLARPLVAA